MLEIKHTLCPSCSVGCGINVIVKDEEIVGSFPYKRHPVNEGKNCLNGRNSIEIFKNKLQNATISNSDADIEKAIDEVKNVLKSADSVTVVASGNNSVEEIEAIKNFAESKNYSVAFYADNLADFEEVATYDDIENAKCILVIGDILYENPLIGRRIVRAKQNGAAIHSLVNSDSSVTANISDECSQGDVSEFLDANADNLDDDAIIIFNCIGDAGDLEKIKGFDCKVLPVFSKSNTKGTFNYFEAKSLDEMLELLDNTKILLVFNDDIASEIEFDYSKISKIISFAYFENETTKMSDIVIPIKSWLEKDGSFINAMGESQTFTAAVESDVLSEIEIIEKLN